MNKKKDYSVTELNKCDRKVLDKYTKFNSNFVENNEIKYNSVDEQSYKNRE